MSVEATRAVWRYSQTKGGARLVMLALADEANHEGYVTAYRRSQSHLAQMTLLDQGTVRRGLKAAQDAGELEILERGDGRRSTDYRLVLPGLEGVQNAPPGDASRAPSPRKSRGQGGAERAPHHPVIDPPSPTGDPDDDAPITLEAVMAKPCCHLHQPEGCCDPRDCGPCCERCPTCPTLQRQAVEMARPTFEVFWAAYPRKVGRRAAEAAWGRASRRADQRAIVAGAERYRDDPNREDGYTAHPTTWLNADRWDDPPLPARSNGRGPSRMQRTLANLGGALADEGGDHGQGGNGAGAGQARRGLPAGG